MVCANVHDVVLDSDTLSGIYKNAEKLCDSIKNSTCSFSDDNVQLDLRQCIELLEKCTKMVTSLQLFSRNESIEEVSTASLPYLLLPCLLGDMSNMVSASSAKDRVPVVERVIIYYEDFLKRCIDYELFEGPLPTDPSESTSDAATSVASSLHSQMVDRKTKIERYKESKEKEARLKILNEARNESCDEEVLREFYLLKLKISINETLDNLSHMLQERTLLNKRFSESSFQENHAGNNLQVQASRANATKNGNSLSKPTVLILTRDQLQKSVYGAGYPSIPTMTLDEWYESQCSGHSTSDTGLPERGLKSRTGDPELDSRLEHKEKIEREEEEEMRDDPNLLEKRRQFDNYKDDHRRGSGNTIGKG